MKKFSNCAVAIMQDVSSQSINGFKEKDILMRKSTYLSNCSKAMHICYINMLLREESRLPDLFTVNGSHFPTKELNQLMIFISAQFFLICSAWKKFFVTNEIRFYC